MASPDITAADIDALLPQTQCGDCNFDGCLPYAKALVDNTAPLDACTPGGVETLQALGVALQRPITQSQRSQMGMKTRPAAKVIIIEDSCIGCTKCIKACPVDAIMGSAKHMHTIIEKECTGCELCVAPCPVDCIEIIPLDKISYDPITARKRYHTRNTRLKRQALEKKKKHLELRQQSGHQTFQTSQSKTANTSIKKALIAEAVKRAKAKRSIQEAEHEPS